MQTPEKNTEPFGTTILRTAITSAIIAAILVFAHVLHSYSISKPALLSATWLMVFCIVFGGHYLEVLFINYIKFILPQNMVLFYLVRIVYWYVCAIPLYMLSVWASGLVINTGLRPGSWYAFGFLYIAIELGMHAVMQLRWKKSFYNGVY